MARICIFNTDADLDSAGAPIDHRSLSNDPTVLLVRSKPIRLFGAGVDARQLTLEFLWNSGIDVDSPTYHDLTLRFFLEFCDDRPALDSPPKGTVRIIGDLIQNSGDLVSDPIFAGAFADGLWTSTPNVIEPDGSKPNPNLGILPEQFQWARECTEEVSSTLGDYLSYGANNDRLVNHYPIVRQVLLPSVGVAEKNNIAVRLPLIVHGMWARLALWYSGTALSFARRPAHTYTGRGPAGGAGLDWTFAGGVPANQLLIFAHTGGHSEEKYLEQNEQLPYAYNV